MENIFKNKKGWLTGLLIALIVLTALNFIVTMIDYGSHLQSAENYVVLTITTIIEILIYSFAICALLKNDNFWCKTLFIIVFSYIFLNCLLTFITAIYYFSYNTIYVFYGIGQIIDCLLVVAIGVVYLLTKYGTIKNERVVNILLYIRLVMILINFIIGIIMIAQDYLNWITITTFFMDAILTIIYFLAINDHAPKSLNG